MERCALTVLSSDEQGEVQPAYAMQCRACVFRCDVWADLKPGDPGLTYDGKTNAMLGPRNNIRCLFCGQTS